MRDAKSEKWLKQAVLKKDCEPLTPSFKVRIVITSRASNKVIGNHSKKLSTSYIVYDVLFLYKMFSIVYF